MDMTTPQGRPVLEMAQGGEGIARQGARLIWLGDSMAVLSGYVRAIADERAVGVGLSLDSLRADASVLAVDLAAAAEVYQATGQAVTRYADAVEIAAVETSRIWVSLDELDRVRGSVADAEMQAQECIDTANLYSDDDAEIGLWMPQRPRTPFSTSSLDGPSTGYQMMSAGDGRLRAQGIAADLAAFATWVDEEIRLGLVDYDVAYDAWESSYALCIDGVEQAVRGAADDSAAQAYTRLDSVASWASGVGVTADVVGLAPWLAPFAAPVGAAAAVVETGAEASQAGLSTVNAVDGDTSTELVDVLESAAGIVPYLGTLSRHGELKHGTASIANEAEHLPIPVALEGWRDDIDDAPYVPAPFVPGQPVTTTIDVP